MRPGLLSVLRRVQRAQQAYSKRPPTQNRCCCVLGIAQAKGQNCGVPGTRPERGTAVSDIYWLNLIAIAIAAESSMQRRRTSILYDDL